MLNVILRMYAHTYLDICRILHITNIAKFIETWKFIESPGLMSLGQYTGQTSSLQQFRWSSQLVHL